MHIQLCLILVPNNKKLIKKIKIVIKDQPKYNDDQLCELFNVIKQIIKIK